MTAQRCAAIVAIALIVDACAAGRYGPEPTAKVPEGTRTLKNLSVGERQAMIARAHVWQRIDTRALDLTTGPVVPPAQRIGAELACPFVFPDKPLTGNSPKFMCEARPGDAVKVKYGDKNGEVQAEIAASRLFWALGFKADRMFPSRVRCQNCPADPFAASKADWRNGKPGAGGPQVFDPAAVERPVPGSVIDVPGFEGWAWPELDTVNPIAGGAPRAHVDALKLLAVFVQHSDTKPEQQDVMCAPGGTRRNRAGHETCASPWLVVRDLGTTFGKATPLNNSKMNLEHWSSVRIWKERAPCIGDLSRSMTGSLENPRIGEEGRAFLAARLMLLSDQQIRHLFQVAMADRRDGTIDDWVRVFKQKRDEIVQARCAS